MLARIVQKELLHHLLDFRFIAVFVLCAVLSGLGVYVGSQNYTQQLQQYDIVSERNRATIQASLDRGTLMHLEAGGYRWNRRPEPLSAVVTGLSGMLGQEVRVQYQAYFPFEASLFSTDPIHALFGVLDLSFIVKVILSLCMLLFTYDAVCGEKEAGTLRLYASFPVSRATLALSKLIGSILAALIPFLFAFLLASVLLALSPKLKLEWDDWERMGVLMGVFVLYLMVFAAFGLWVSASTHRKKATFLVLMALWTIWLFAIPALSLEMARRISPSKSAYELERQIGIVSEETRVKRQNEIRDYRQRHQITDLDAAPEAQRRELQEGERKIDDAWNTVFYNRLSSLRTEWRNQKREQGQWIVRLSAISPLSAVSFVSMDVARTGFIQQERIEDALNVHLIYLARFYREKQLQENRDLTDFSLFTYQDRDTLGECLSRNIFHILNLALLAILGFAGAYVAILRYDVR